MGIKRCCWSAAIIFFTAMTGHAQVATSPEYFRRWGSGTPQFDVPAGSATDGTFLYVADSNNHRVGKFYPSGELISWWGVFGSGSAQFNSPRGLAISGSTVYVADKNNNRIQKFTTTGEYLGQWGGAGSGAGQFDAPRDVAVDGDGNVFVVDTGNNRIQEFDSNGVFARQWGAPGEADGEFNFPLGVVAYAGGVFVCDTGNNRVQRFTPQGQFVIAWPSPSPWGIAESSGLIVVSNKDVGTIQGFTSDGTLRWTAGSPGAGSGQFNTPAGVTFLAGLLFVVDSGNSRIHRGFASHAGAFFLDTWGAYGAEAVQFKSLASIAIDASDNVYVLESGQNRIRKFTLGGTLLTAWGGIGSLLGQFTGPMDLAVGPSGSVYVTDPNGFRVREFDGEGAPVRAWAVSDSPLHIAVSRSGVVYVTDNANRVQRFTSTGIHLGEWNIQFASGIAVDANGYVYVSDYSRAEIRKYTSDGVQLGAWSTPSPRQITVDAQGYVYASAPGSYRLQKFNTAGILLAEWGLQGSADGEVGGLADIALDSRGDVYVADISNNRIQGFRYTNNLGIFADLAGTQRVLCAPPFAATTLHLAATTGTATASGITKAEFRIEVTNPTGYLFSYTPPVDAFVTGNAFDLTPSDPNDPAGVTVVFSSCRPVALPRAAGDRIDFGTVNVVNIGGGPTDLLIKRKNPPDAPQAFCPRFYECDFPFFTAVCMSSAESDSIVFRASLNGTLCQAAPPQPFVTETLFLDTHDAGNDGEVGPLATLQALDSRQTYLVTVDGTFSIWPAPDWGPPPIVICGTPERTPQSPSPGVTNGWVGLDAEIDFSVPLAAGGDCASLPAQGYPRHPGRFRIDLGSGFSHLEPLGGAPTDPAPGHRYRYMVQGQDSPIRFAWADSAASDNYGVLEIVVEQRNVTSVESAPVPRRLTMLPCVPNPFNPSTEIRYELPAAGKVEVTIYDVRGRMLRRVFSGAQLAGYQSVRWDGRLDSGDTAGSGVYFSRVVTSDGAGTARLTLIK